MDFSLQLQLQAIHLIQDKMTNIKTERNLKSNFACNPVESRVTYSRMDASPLIYLIYFFETEEHRFLFLHECQDQLIIQNHNTSKEESKSKYTLRTFILHYTKRPFVGYISSYINIINKKLGHGL